MIYRDFCGHKLSMLGFGTMRLPCSADGEIDQAAFEEMMDTAVSSGVNYFDTAYPYHQGRSELALGKALKKYDRNKLFIATKYPGHQISSSYAPREVFEHQLQKCGVEYFDFYLLHNVYENSMDVYLDPKWGILDYFKEQKRLGRIRHLGFSTHGRVENMRKFLDIVGDDMEFCQIQLNWLDWTLQNAKEKVQLLNECNIPIWVMEPVRGGKLCKLDSNAETKLKALRPNDGIPAWGFKFLEDIPGVTMILSGMSNLSQMRDNINTFERFDPLSENERQALFDIAEGMKNSVPCTSCGYCMESCPVGLNIPLFIATLNDLRVAPVTNSIMCLDALDDAKQPSCCLGCGECAKMCPQNIDIPGAIAELNERLITIPKWKDISKAREEEARRLLGK